MSANGSNDMQKCDHEEADTRISVHVLHALQKGASRVNVRTLDTNVAVILIGIFHKILALFSSTTDFWIAFCIGLSQALIPCVPATCIHWMRNNLILLWKRKKISWDWTKIIPSNYRIFSDATK